MLVTLLLVGALSVAAYTIGRAVGRVEMGNVQRSRTHSYHIDEKLQQAYVDEPGNPRMN